MDLMIYFHIENPTFIMFMWIGPQTDGSIQLPRHACNLPLAYMVTAVHYMEQSVVDSKLRHHFHVIKRAQYCSKECIFSQNMLLSKWHGVEFKGSTLFFITSFKQCKTNTFIDCLELFSCVKWRLTRCNILYSTMVYIVKYYRNQS